MTIKIRIYGSGCRNCLTLENRVKNAVARLNLSIPVKIEKVTDVTKFIDAGVTLTPALEINGKIVTQGQVTSEQEIRTFMHPFIKQ